MCNVSKVFWPSPPFPTSKSVALAIFYYHTFLHVYALCFLNSRAHTIVGITLTQKAKNAAGQETAKKSVVNLVDLAGRWAVVFVNFFETSIETLTNILSSLLLRKYPVYPYVIGLFWYLCLKFWVWPVIAVGVARLQKVGPQYLLF